MMDVRPETPRNLVQVIERGLHVDPSQRYATAADLAAALKRAAHESNILLSPRETAVFVNSIIGDKIQENQRDLEHTIQRSANDSESEILEMHSFTQHSVPSGIEMSTLPLSGLTPPPTPTPAAQVGAAHSALQPSPETKDPSWMPMMLLAFLILALIGLGALKYGSDATQVERPVSTAP